jgi:hypothetical protein
MLKVPLAAKLLPIGMASEEWPRSKLYLSDLKLYYYSNEPWLFPSTSARVEEFIKLAESIVDSHPPDLKDIDFLETEEGRWASMRMSLAMPVVMSKLIREFRTVLYPPPWYDAPLRALEWLQTRTRRDDAQEQPPTAVLDTLSQRRLIHARTYKRTE